MRLRLLLALFAAVATARADEPAMIAKARAYLGAEDALNGVKSLHLVCKYVAVDNPENPTNQTTMAVDIVFQRPWQYRLIATPEGEGGKLDAAGARTMALDGYEAWERSPDPTSPTHVQLGLLRAPQILALRAALWENLCYYRGIEATGGSIEDQGPATIDGVACEKIAFIHSPTITYYRYFDQATGRLVYTETIDGLKIREQGDLMVDGIRFSQKNITLEKLPNGTPRLVTITVEHVTVNEAFPDSAFALPLPPGPVFTLPAPAAGAPVSAPKGAPPGEPAAPAAP
jgi:hypothetical protein